MVGDGGCRMTDKPAPQPDERDERQRRAWDAYMGARFCTCCGEPFRATMDSPLGGECACEWDGDWGGCDENCPAVGHLYATTKGGAT